jgi:hypothetical protein
MRSEVINIYKFHELSEDAKKKAINWYLSNPDYDWHEFIKEDAKQIGLNILSFNCYRLYWGITIDIVSKYSYIEVMDRILSEYIDTSDMYICTLKYKNLYHSLSEDDNYDNNYDELINNFKNEIGQIYLLMLESYLLYIESDEYAIECIAINEYEFTKDGVIY